MAEEFDQAQLAAFIRGLDEIEAKWIAIEDQGKAELQATPSWRVLRRARLIARLQGISEGLLELNAERTECRHHVRR